MRYAYLAVCLALLGALFSGCGGGTGTKTASRRAGKVVIHIVVPSKSAQASRAGQKGRFIPSNTQSVQVNYTSIDTTGAVNPIASVAVNTAVSTTVTLPDVLAGANISLLAAAYDNTTTDNIHSTGNALASGSATINLQPGTTATPTITLVSGMTSLIVNSVTPFTATVGQTFTITALTAIAVNSVTLHWSALTANVALTSAPTYNTGTRTASATFTALKSGNASVQVAYQETGTPTVTATANGVIRTTTLTFASATPITATGGAVVSLANAFGLAGDSVTAGTGYALFNDAAFPITTLPAVTTGASRIAPFNPTQGADAASFDPTLASAYSGVNSRMAFLPPTAGHPLPAWAVLDNGRKNINAFSQGSNAATGVTTRWPATFSLLGSPNLFAVALDAEPSAVLNVLEVNTGTGAVQLQRLNQDNGVPAPTTIALTGGALLPATFAPINMATIVRADGTRDVYLANYPVIFPNVPGVAKLTLSAADAATLTSASFVSGVSAPISIATSDVDPSYLYVLDQSTSAVYAFYTLDGSLAATVPLHGVVGANSKVAARQGWLYVLDAAPGGVNAQVERYQIGAQ